MHRNFIVVFVTLVILQFGHGSSVAQTALTDIDRRVGEMMKEKPESAVLIVDANIWYEGRPWCSNPVLYLKSREGKTAIIDAGTSISVAPEGEYFVMGATCSATKSNYRGIFAKIRIARGEIINAGKLVIDPKIEHFWSRKFTHQSRVEDLSPKTISDLKEKSPVTFSKATKRYFTPIQGNAAPAAPKT